MQLAPCDQVLLDIAGEHGIELVSNRGSVHLVGENLFVVDADGYFHHVLVRTWRQLVIPSTRQQQKTGPTITNRKHLREAVATGRVRSPHVSMLSSFGLEDVAVEGVSHKF